MRYALASAALLLLATIAVGGSVDAQSQYFTPCADAELQDTNPGVGSPVTFTWGIGVGDDCVRSPATDNPDQYMIAELIQFIPPQWGVARDADIADGTVVGSVRSEVTMGLLNNPCTNSVPVDLTVYEGTTDMSEVVQPLPPGTPSRWVRGTRPPPP